MFVCNLVLGPPSLYWDLLHYLSLIYLYVWTLDPLTIGTFVWNLLNLYLQALTPFIGTFIWSLCLEPLTGTGTCYWNQYLQDLFLALLTYFVNWIGEMLCVSTSIKKTPPTWLDLPKLQDQKCQPPYPTQKKHFAFLFPKWFCREDLSDSQAKSFFLAESCVGSSTGQEFAKGKKSWIKTLKKNQTKSHHYTMFFGYCLVLLDW